MGRAKLLERVSELESSIATHKNQGDEGVSRTQLKRQVKEIKERQRLLNFLAKASSTGVSAPETT